MSGENVKTEREGVWYDSGCYCDKNWKDTKFCYSGDAIPDEKTALAVAEAIYYNLPLYNRDEREPFWVFYDEIDEIWIVHFGKPPEFPIIYIGGDCNIALQKKDAKVLKIWYGE